MSRNGGTIKDTAEPNSLSKLIHLLPCDLALRQGLNWYAEQLREDRDGDTADEFLVEPSMAPVAPPRAQVPQGADSTGLRSGPPPVQPRTDPALKVCSPWPVAASRTGCLAYGFPVQWP